MPIMKTEQYFSIAVIADAHFHDVEGAYGVSGVVAGERCLTLRTWDDTRTSTRVFNESASALEAALAAVAGRNIKHVVLLGDYTDDGQRITTASAAKLFAEHEARLGTRFYALPGNHDIFGPEGRHQAKYFLQADGTQLLVTSDASENAESRVLNPGMYCEGYPEGLTPMAAFGYFRRAEYLHWETPFGHSDQVSDRTYDVSSPDEQNRYTLMDASYLVEPEDGLWLLMLDANVFEPRDGEFARGSEQAFIDSTAAGWNSMLRCKPFIFDWISDIARRARQQGKTLLAFSHYPVIDVLDDPAGRLDVLFPTSTMGKRRPIDAVAKALIAAGVTVHFSGHLHIEGISRRDFNGGELTNVAVPSLVAFPPAFKHLTIKSGSVDIETVSLSALPVDEDMMDVYRHEMSQAASSPDKALLASTYGEFLRQHTTALVVNRFFQKEWPRDVVACLAPMTVAQLCQDARTRPTRFEPMDGPWTHVALNDLPMVEIISDWYCLQQAGQSALPVLGEERLGLLQGLAALYANDEPRDDDHPAKPFLRIFFQSMVWLIDRANRPVEPIRLAAATL